MDALQAFDQRWTHLLVVCGVPLVVFGIVIRLLSRRSNYSWSVGNAALYLGVVLLGFAVLLHYVMPYLFAKMRQALPR